MMNARQLDLTFAALADPTRRAILGRLSKGEMTVNQLAEPFRMSLPGVSKHLKVLARAGLIERGREAQWRPCRLNAAPLKGVAEWIEEYRRFWEDSFDRLDEYLKELQAKEKKRWQAQSELAGPATISGDRDIVASRVFDAPRDKVFRLWTDPVHLARWWGPRGFEITTFSMDFKPGGSWQLVMHGPDGRDYVNHVTFLEIVPGERIVFKHGGGRQTEPVNHTSRVSFESEGNKTRVTMRMTFESGQQRDMVATEFGAVAGLDQTMDRLREQAGAVGTAEEDFIVSRTFDAPQKLMWEVWSKREHLTKWFGPKGVVISHGELDFRPGGIFHYCMRPATGQEMWGKFEFREIVEPQRMVWVNSFSDAAGGLTRHPLSPTWPLKMLTTVTFAERDGKTTVTVRWKAIEATAEERATFHAARGGMNAGWSGTFDQLGEYVGSLAKA